MMAQQISRCWTVVALSVVLPTGYLSRFNLPATEMTRDVVGGAAYVVAVALVLLIAWPWLAAVQAAATAFLLTCIVEVTQLVSVPWLDALRATKLGRIALGSTFAVGDFPAYAVGGLIAWAIAAVLPRRPA